MTITSNRAVAFFRIYMSALALILCYIGVSEPRSMLGLLAKLPEGYWIMAMMFTVGAMGMVDAVINDILPKRFSWQGAHRQRHFILAALAFCYVSQLYIAVAYIRSTGMLLFYLLNAFSLILVAFLDAGQRSQDAECANA